MISSAQDPLFLCLQPAHKMATAAAVVFSALTNRSVRLSHDLHDLPSPSNNLVHIARPHAAVHDQHAAKLLSKPGVKVCDAAGGIPSCSTSSHQHAPMVQPSLTSLTLPFNRCLLLMMQAVVDVSKPQPAIEYLLSCVTQPDLQQQLHHDLQQAVQLLSTTLQQRDHVSAKLQIIQQQSCPNWHADTVGVRMLCTYAGPGTWYIANR